MSLRHSAGRPVSPGTLLTRDMRAPPLPRAAREAGSSFCGSGGVVKLLLVLVALMVVINLQLAAGPGPPGPGLPTPPQSAVTGVPAAPRTASSPPAARTTPPPGLTATGAGAARNLKTLEIRRLGKEPGNGAKSRVEKGAQVGLPGPIQHETSGLCLHPFGGGNSVGEFHKLILFEGCYGEDRLKYVLKPDGTIRHVHTGSCLVAGDGKSPPTVNSPIRLSKAQCGQDASLWAVDSKGSIKHTATGYCVHIKGGMRAPPPKTELVLHPKCGLERNQFYIISAEPVNLPRSGLTAYPVVPPGQEPRRVAVSILITKDPGKTGGFIDSAASLAMSVMEAKSRYHIELVAIVAKRVVECRYALERIGFKVLERELPVTPEQIRNPQIAREIVTDGCCGIWELLKLHAWKLTEYDRVLQLDTDVMFHKNFDELFEIDRTLVWTHGALGGSERINGGFLVVRPNPADFDAMVEIIKTGDFRNGRGWKGKCCWVYGGRTIQGIVPMYYLYEKPEAQYEVDRCQYNNMVEIDRCKTWRYKDVTSNHFTVCQKPFHCSFRGPKLCKSFNREWWRTSHKVEKALGLSPRRECGRGGYKAIEWSAVPKDKVLYRNPVWRGG